MLRALDEDRLRTALLALLRPPDPRGRAANSVNSVAALGRSQLSQGRRLPGVALRRASRSVPGSTPVPTAAAPNASATASPVGSTPVAAAATYPATNAGTTPRPRRREHRHSLRHLPSYELGHDRPHEPALQRGHD